MDNVKADLRENKAKKWNRFMWLRIGTGERLI
jgi:hypothetical protein